MLRSQSDLAMETVTGAAHSLQVWGEEAVPQAVCSASLKETVQTAATQLWCSTEGSHHKTSAYCHIPEETGQVLASSLLHNSFYQWWN